MHNLIFEQSYGGKLDCTVQTLQKTTVAGREKYFVVRLLKEVCCSGDCCVLWLAVRNWKFMTTGSQAI